MSEHDAAGTPPPSPFVTGPAGRCPRCGKGKLFDGYLTPAKRCEACGFDLSFADAGDGAAVFIILIVGLIVVAEALIVELTYRPPYWVHAAIAVPLTLVLALGLLRPVKGLLLALQYRNSAREGRLEGGA